MAARKTKSVPVNAVVLKDKILWAVIERRLLHNKIVGLYTSADAADATAAFMDSQSGLSFNKYIVQRAELVE